MPAPAFQQADDSHIYKSTLRSLLQEWASLLMTDAAGLVLPIPSHVYVASLATTGGESRLKPGALGCYAAAPIGRRLSMVAALLLLSAAAASAAAGQFLEFDKMFGDGAVSRGP